MNRTTHESVISKLRSEEIPFIIGGGYALQKQGIRNANDVDLIIYPGYLSYTRELFNVYDIKFTGDGFAYIQIETEGLDVQISYNQRDGFSFEEIYERGGFELDNNGDRILTLLENARWKLESGRIKDIDDIILIMKALKKQKKFQEQDV